VERAASERSWGDAHASERYSSTRSLSRRSKRRAGPFAPVGERLVSQRDTLGSGRRARGVVEDREVVRSSHAPRAPRRWLFGETGEQLVEGDRLGATRRDGGGGLIAQSAVPEDQARRDVVEDAGKIGPSTSALRGLTVAP